MARKPDDLTQPFVVSDRIRELAKQNNWPDPSKEVDAFLDYWEMRGWITQRRVKIVDREAAFRTWLRIEAKRRAERDQDEPKRAPYWDKRLG